ncbi:MAG: V4R domain-containing protein [Candidatus Bathycorpusculaceae bacterium]
MCAYQLIKGGVQQKLKGYFKPLNIGRIMIFNENRRIYGVVIESTIGKGVLRKLSELAENLDITIRYIQYSMEKIDNPTVTAIAFLDFSQSKTSPEEAMKILKTQKFVKNAQIINASSNGMIYDSYFFPITLEGERVVIFRRSVYEALLNGIRKKFGSAGEAMLYYQGFSIGFEIYDEYVKIAKSEEPGDLIEIAKAVNMTLGWGIADKVKVDVKKGAAMLRIYHNFECELGKNNGRPYSQFYRGAIAGIFTRFFGKDVKITETKCIAKGDPYCEFIVKMTL